MTISEQLKSIIRASGVPAYRIAKDCEVSNATLSRFLSEDPEQHRDIRLERTADKLAAYFGLQLVAGAPAKPTGKATKKAKR